MKGVVLLAVLSLCLAAEPFHRHPHRNHLQTYGSVKADPGVTGVLQIISGLLMAVGSKTNETDIVGCLTNLASVDTNIQAAVSELKAMTWDSVEAGIRDLANALEVVPTAMNNCAGSVTEDSQLLHGLLQKFEHPATFFFQLELHLMVDGIDILSNINGALSDWDSGNWYGFGYDFGTALVLFINGQEAKLNPAHVLEVVTGLLEGISADLGLTDIQDCLQDVGTLGTEIHSAYEELLQASVSSVEAGIRDLAQALEQIPSAIQTCKAADTVDLAKIEAALSSFKNPISFVFHVGHDLIVNGKQIFNEIDAAVLAYHSKNYQAFGNAIGQALAALLVGESEAKLNPAHVLEVVTGLLEGIAADLGLTDIQDCLQDVGTLGTEIHSAYEELLQASVSSVEAGIRDLAQALEQIPSAIQTCKAADTVDLAKIEAALSSFKNPMSFVFHVGHDLIINGRQIFTEIDAAVLAYHNKNYQAFGNAIGQALAAILVGGPANLSVSHTLEVVAGLLEGIAADLALTDIENCITDAESIGVDIHNAYEEILQASFSSVKSGLADLAQALEVVPSAITACKAGATTDVAKIEAMLAAFSSPVSFVFHVAKDLIVNGRQIFKEVSSGVRAYHAGNYTSFGFYMGEAMAAAIVGEKEVVVNVLDVVGGLLEGLADGIALSDIQNCVTDTETIAANLFTAVMQLKNATNPTNAKLAIHDFGVALEFLPGAITNCKSVPQDAAAIEKMIANFESPMSFIFVVGKNLVLNGNEIYDEMATAISDWDSQNWFGFGENLGEALAKTFL